MSQRVKPTPVLNDLAGLLTPYNVESSSLAQIIDAMRRSRPRKIFLDLLEMEEDKDGNLRDTKRYSDGVSGIECRILDRNGDSPQPSDDKGD